MAAAALMQRQRRGGTDHRFVVGTFYLVGDRVVLHAVECGPAYDVPRPPVLTDDARRFNRWRTRQAAHQFCQRWHLDDCHVVDLHFLDVLRVEAPLTRRKPRASRRPGRGTPAS